MRNILEFGSKHFPTDITVALLLMITKPQRQTDENCLILFFFSILRNGNLHPHNRITTKYTQPEFNVMNYNPLARQPKKGKERRSLFLFLKYTILRNQKGEL